MYKLTLSNTSDVEINPRGMGATFWTKYIFFGRQVTKKNNEHFSENGVIILGEHVDGGMAARHVGSQLE